ncbi:MAG: hypothetical protein MJZ76_01150 [Bacteroidales bacterium]|nr:hypothetical protein [Bacteroidales bacterium]
MAEDKKSFFKYVRPVLILLLLCGVITICVVAMIHQRNRSCEKVEVTLSYQGEHKPISEKEVLAVLNKAGVSTVGVAERDIDYHAIYEVLGENKYIKTVKPVFFIGNVLHIDVELYEAVVHVYPQDGSDFFLCEDGHILPYSNRIQERLLLAVGSIPELQKNVSEIEQAGPTLKRIYDLARIIRENEFYSAQFKQIRVNEDKELELVASVGKHTVLLGKGTNAEEQLANLCVAYRQGIAYTEPGKYSQFDLRYKNRIIAKQR